MMSPRREFDLVASTDSQAWTFVMLDAEHDAVLSAYVLVENIGRLVTHGGRSETYLAPQCPAVQGLLSVVHEVGEFDERVSRVRHWLHD
jgi:hypothetical protein